MKKIIKAIKKIELDVVLLLTIIIALDTIFELVLPGDELWNFANVYKMFNGYKIYEDLNVIITPLFFYMAQIFLKIFGANILSFRIYNVFISLVYFLLIYKIFRNLQIEKKKSFLFTMVLLYIYMQAIKFGANYNLMCMIPILIAILLIIKGKENYLIIGTLLFITFMLKQNIFIYFALGIFINEFCKNKKIKNIIMELIRIYAVTLVELLMFFVWLYVDGNLYNFINYCFLGINEFGANNIGISYDGGICVCLAIMIIAVVVFIINQKGIKERISDKELKNIEILLSFGIPLVLICYPILNYYHAVLGVIVIMIAFFYLINQRILNGIKLNTKIASIICAFGIIVIYIYWYSNNFISVISKIKTGENIINTTGSFCGSIMTKKDSEDIKIITNYIRNKENEGIKVKILSYSANFYMLELNRNNGIFDLAFLGNMGEKGEDGLMNEIKNLKNTIILMKKEKTQIFWQESIKARKFIEENYELIGEIQDFNIYYINE